MVGSTVPGYLGGNLQISLEEAAQNLEEKKEQVISSIREQEKLTPELEQQILAAATLVAVCLLYTSDDEVLIVDEFTGRIMPGRRYSDGLHQAIEAKEHVNVRRESKTLATLSLIHI